MKNLQREDLDWCVMRLPKSVQKVLKIYPGKVSLAGGFIRSCITGDVTKDIDLFVDSEETAKKAVDVLEDDFFTSRTFKTANAYTILREGKTTVQFIYKWVYTRPEDILNDFDFTICCAVIWYEGAHFQSAINNYYYSDLAAKRLRYANPSRIEEAGGSVLRVLKYYSKGYKIMLTSFDSPAPRVID